MLDFWKIRNFYISQFPGYRPPTCKKLETGKCPDFSFRFCGFQIFRISDFPGFPTVWVSDSICFQLSELPGCFLTSLVSGFLISKFPIFQVFFFPGFCISGFPTFQGSEFPGFQVFIYLTFWVSISKGFWLSEFLGFKFSGFSTAEVSNFPSLSGFLNLTF